MKMNQITLHHPSKIVFGVDSLQQVPSWIAEKRIRNLLVLVSPPLIESVSGILARIKESNTSVITDYSVTGEPSVEDVERILAAIDDKSVDCVMGIGGGSVMDAAKVVAACIGNPQPISEMTGIGNLRGRSVPLICIPSTAGTGSEVSPNSILIDTIDNTKKAVISPFLVPDASFIDPLLTCSVPPSVTATTGIDALTHCIEAFTNKQAHPLTDSYALEGIRLIVNNLEKACRNGSDPDARSNLALGSLYGGLCLGPVNTAAVHALAYPLGNSFHLSHGLSIAVLLPHVLDFNLPCGVEKYAAIGKAIGVPQEWTAPDAAREGVKRIGDLCREVGIPEKVFNPNREEDPVPYLAQSAMTVRRLLKNNLREVTEEDARMIYRKLF